MKKFSLAAFAATMMFAAPFAGSVAFAETPAPAATCCCKQCDCKDCTCAGSCGEDCKCASCGCCKK